MKIEVAEKQLLQSIRLFFNDEDPISIHTLAEASNQILYDLNKFNGTKSIRRDHNWMDSDMKKMVKITF